MRKIKNISCGSLLFLTFLFGTLVFSGPVSAKELAYDDGICNDGYPEIHSTQKLRQQFLLSDFGLSGVPLVEKVRIYWGTSSQDFAGVITLRDYGTSDVAVAAIADSPSLSFVNPPQYAWQDYDVSGLGFYSDHFYVELSQTSEYGYIGMDTDPPYHEGMSQSDPGNGIWYPWLVSDNPVNFMIRVDVREERPLGALPASQCTGFFEIVNAQGVTEKMSATFRLDYEGCIIEESVIFYKSSDCTGDGFSGDFENPLSTFVYKSGTRGGCAGAVEVTANSPACVTLTLKSGRKTTVCY